MERIFEPITEREDELVQIIKTNPFKEVRKNALKSLLVLNGCEIDDLYSIRSIEVYQHIPNKPITYRKFLRATVMYDDCKLKRK